MNPQNPNIQEILKTLSQFGFNYFGNDENGAPLVYAPNGQVVPLDVAYNFVKNQIEQTKVSSSSSGSIESVPQMPQSTPEKSLESTLEHSLDIKKPESNIESQQNQSQQQTQAVQGTVPAPVIVKPKPLPYGDGFKPKNFDPTDIAQTLNFIEQNKKQSDTASNKWLAIQFEKFLNEMKAGKL